MSSHRSWVGKCLSKISVDILERSEIKLLEEFRAHGDASSGTEAIEVPLSVLLMVVGNAIGVAVALFHCFLGS